MFYKGEHYQSACVVKRFPENATSFLFNYTSNEIITTSKNLLYPHRMCKINRNRNRESSLNKGVRTLFTTYFQSRPPIVYTCGGALLDS